MVIVEAMEGKSVEEQGVEIVERKGKGHPDYMCDSIMDAISVALCREYQREFGTILHHNIDKGLLAAGKTVKQFGGGSLLKPMELIIGDRATFRVGGKEIPVSEIAVDTAKIWFKKNMRFVDPKKNIKYKVVLAEGSEELKDIFLRPGEVRGANDTSAAIGFYPLSSLEQTVLNLERYLNSTEYKKRFPETGEDVKVMGLRRGRDIDVTVAMPLLSKLISSEDEYFQRKRHLTEDMSEFLKDINKGYFTDIRVYYNALDKEGRGLGGIYMSLLGTSAEDADSGQVGRGNRVNGLISVNRPMGTEAVAGKNPVSHVGKIYNVLAHKLAKKIYEVLGEGVKEVYVMLLSKIGTPINHPQTANAKILFEQGKKRDVKGIVEGVIHRELENINDFCLALAEGKYPVC